MDTVPIIRLLGRFTTKYVDIFIGLLCIKRLCLFYDLKPFDLIVILCGMLAVVELSQGFLVFFGFLSFYKLFFQ